MTADLPRSSEDILRQRIEELETALRFARKVCGCNTMNCPGARSVRTMFDAVFPDEPRDKLGSRGH